MTVSAELRQTVEESNALLAEMKRVKDTKKDYVVPAGKLALEAGFGPNSDEVRLAVTGLGVAGYPTFFNVRRIAHEHLSEKLNIPLAYYKRMLEEKPGLLARNVNTWLADNGRNYLVRTLDTDLRALLGDTYRCIDNYDAVAASLPHLTKAQAQILRLDLTEERLYLRALHRDFRAILIGPNGKGNVGEVCPGILIRNSEVGRSAFSVDLYVHCFTCGNGAYREQSLRQVHSGQRHAPGELDLASDETRRLEDAAFWSRVGDMIGQGMDADQWRNTLDKLQGNAKTELANPVEAVNNVVKAFDLGGEDVAQGLLLELMRPSTPEVDPGMTLWGLQQAVTDLARQTEEKGETDKAFDLMRVGGELMSFTPKVRELVRVR